MICGASLTNGKACQNKVSTGERCWRHKGVSVASPKTKSPKTKVVKASPKTKVVKASPKTKVVKASPKTKVVKASPKTKVVKASPKTKAKSKAKKESKSDSPIAKPRVAKPKKPKLQPPASPKKSPKARSAASPKRSLEAGSGIDIVWKATKDGDTITYTAFLEGTAIKYKDMVRKCISNPEMLKEFVSCIIEISKHTIPFMLRFPKYPSSVPFSFSVAQSKDLQRITPNYKSFEDHFTGENETVTFMNISKDTLLVVPEPPGEYTHIHAFSLKAPFDKQVNFWHEVFTQLVKFSKGKDIWLNTHGLGVHWLHVRLDTEPKYYPKVSSKKQETSLEEALIAFGKPKYPETVTKRDRITTKTIGDREMRLNISRRAADNIIVTLQIEKTGDDAYIRLVYYHRNGKWSLKSSSFVLKDMQYDYVAAEKDTTSKGHIRLEAHPESGQKPPQYILDFFDPN